LHLAGHFYKIYKLANVAEKFLCRNYVNGIMQSRNGNIAYMGKLLVFPGGGTHLEKNEQRSF